MAFWDALTPRDGLFGGGGYTGGVVTDTPTPEQLKTTPAHEYDENYAPHDEIYNDLETKLKTGMITPSQYWMGIIAADFQLIGNTAKTEFSSTPRAGIYSDIYGIGAVVAFAVKTVFNVIAVIGSAIVELVQDIFGWTGGYGDYSESINDELSATAEEQRRVALEELRDQAARVPESGSEALDSNSNDGSALDDARDQAAGTPDTGSDALDGIEFGGGYTDDYGNPLPIILDLDGDGFEFVSLEESTAFFDVDEDGYRENVGWAGPDDGFLVIDLNGDGLIDQAQELSFGAQTDLFDSDLEALAANYDTHGPGGTGPDGVLNSYDAEWSKFGVWQDLDQDGETDEGEFKSLDEIGITEIQLSSDGIVAEQDGNTILGSGQFIQNQETLDFGDVRLDRSLFGFRQTANGSLEIAGAEDQILILANSGNASIDLSLAGLTGVQGADGDDVFIAGSGNPVMIDGGPGDDTILGSSSDDWISGGAGADRLSGGAGNDVLYFDAEDTEVDGGADYDIAFVSSAASVTIDLAANNLEAVFGNLGDDVFFTSGDEAVFIDGGDGNDTLSGGSGGDVLIGGAGADILSGGAGDDVLFVDAEDLVANIDGGDGEDFLLVATEGGITVDLGAIDVEMAFGNAGDDVFTNSTSKNVVVHGGGGDDTITGGSGNDTIVGGQGADNLNGGDGGDYISYTDSNAGVSVDLATNTASGGHADGDTIASFEGVIGSGYDDTLSGNNWNNGIYGGYGNDTLSGIEGGDFLDGGAGSDTAAYTDSTAGVTVNLVEGTGVGGHAEGDELINIENVSGSSANGDALTGDDGANILSGLGGNDVLTGGGGDDELIGGTGSDSLVGGDGVDTASYMDSSAGVTINLMTGTGTGGDAQGDTLSGIENLTGSDYSDSLTGDDGDNSFIGGAGADVLVGGDGLDTADYSGSEAAVSVDLALGTASGGDAEGDSLTEIENVLGTSMDDVLTGNSQDNLLTGGAGADTLTGGSGSDTASYENSDDAVTIDLDSSTAEGGEAEGDTLSGIENVIGSDGDDFLVGDSNDNALFGQAGNDFLSGGGGADDLDGGEGTDTASYATSAAGVTVHLAAGVGLGGDADGDTLSSIEKVVGSSSSDLLTGGSEDEEFEGGAGADVIMGEAGTDTASYTESSAAVSINLAAETAAGGDAEGDTLVDIENLAGSEHDDRLTGDSGSNRLDGNAGDDILVGGAGADILVGGEGSDTADYSGSENAISIDLGDGTASGGDAEGDSLSEVENIIGTAGADSLTGDENDNIFEGGASGDSLDGGWGNDTASYADSAAAITIDLSEGIASGGYAEGDSLTDIESIRGSEFADELTGNAEWNTIEGGGGADTIVGGKGVDTVSYEHSSAAVSVNLGSSSCSGGDAEGDTLTTIENIRGSNYADTLTGDAGRNLLEGGLGADILDGGDSIDMASFETSAEGVTVSLTTGTGIGGDAEGDYLSNIEGLVGSANDDVLTGDAGANNLYGLDGDDLLAGGAGPDLLLGGLGEDTASYSGSDSAVTVDLYTGEGVGGHAEKDTLRGIENVIGSGFDDSFISGSLGNILEGGAGNDSVSYEHSRLGVTADLVEGMGFGGFAEGDTYSSIENLSGSSFDDFFVADANANEISGGDGADVISYAHSTSAVSVDLSTGTASGGYAQGDTLTDIEGAIGTEFADTLTGDDADNLFEGGDGADTLTGGVGSDTLSYASSDAAVSIDLGTGTVSGGHAQGDSISGFENVTGSSFDDTLTGDGNDNVLIGGAGADTITGAAGDDTVSYADSDAAVTIDLSVPSAAGGDAEGDTLSGIENVIGSSNDDVLTGDANGNTIEGGDGADILTAGAGSDTLSYARSDYGVSVSLSDETATGGHATGDTISGFENVTGSTHDDNLTGDGNANVLSGGEGDDFLMGGVGADILQGGDGTDTASYADSASGVTVDLAAGTGTGGDAQGDTLSGIENLTGSESADTLEGDSNDNILEGGSGNDTLTGGDGTDIAVFTGNFADYTISVNSGVYSVYDDAPSTDGDDGTDTLSGIETLRFANGDLDISDLPSPAETTVATYYDGVLEGQLEATAPGYTQAELVFSLEDDAAHGSVIVNADGSYEYTPDADFAGSDSFTYRVSDPTGLLSIVATVSMDVESKVGTETAVNTTTADDQDTPSIAALSGGGYVVTWNSWGQDGSYCGVFGQLYDSFGNPVGSEFQVNNYTSANQGWSSVAGLADGGFVVTWDSYNQDGSYWGVYGQRYDSSGNTVGSEFRINTTTYDYQQLISVTALSDGGFVGTWSSWGQDGDDYGIFGQRYDSSGNTVGSEFQINTNTSDDQDGPSIGALSSGGFVVTWNSYGQDGSSWGIFGQRYDSSGDTVGSEFQVNTFTSGNQGAPSVAALLSGGFVVTWDSYNGDGDVWGVSGQIYDASGNAVGSEFQVNTFTSDDQWGSSVTGLSDGGFVVTWVSDGQDGSNSGVYAQYFDSDGDPVGSEFLVNSYTSEYQGDPSVTVLANGNVAVAWNSNNQDGDGWGVYSKILPGSFTFNGSSGPDVFIASEADEILNGSAGDDVLSGAGGDDILSGGDGDDVLTGGSGSDNLDGGAGVDTVSYDGSAAGVTVDLSTGTVSGGDADGDTITAFENVRGSSESDVLTGNSGDNVIEGGANGDVIVGGDGNDTVSYEHSSSGVSVNLATSTHSGGDAAGDTLTSIENIRGSDFDDALTGDSGANILQGGAGDDTLVGGAGADTFDGGTGTDSVSFAASASGVTVDLGAGTGVGSDAEGDSFSGVEDIVGSDSGDSLTGDDESNALSGGLGEDVIEGGGGADDIDGGTGTDTAVYSSSTAGVTVDLAAGTGTGGHAEGDTLSGIESLTGSGFADVLTGDTSANSLSGGAGNDTLEGGTGADAFDGGVGFDTASYAGSSAGVTVDLATGTGSGGDAAGDTLTDIENLVGSAQADVLTGDSADNTLEGGGGADTLNGGDGSDTVSYAGSAAAVSVDLSTGTVSGGDAAGDTLTSIENIVGSASNDSLEGDGGDNTLSGAGGDDTLIGGAGADVLDGGAGSDSVSYADSSSGITVDLADGTGLGGDAEGDQLIRVENISGTDFDDTISGNWTTNTLTGGAGNDLLDGAEGDDVLNGGDGDDVLTGGSGADTLNGGEGTDTASFEGSYDGVTVDLSVPSASGGAATGDTLSSIENLTGSDFDDTLTGDSGDNVIEGGSGADTLTGGSGSDTLSFAGSEEAVTVNLADATSTGGDAGEDTFSGFENLSGSANADTLTGDSSANTISGGEGDDLLTGGAGADTLQGGDGTDTASYADAGNSVTVDLAAGTGTGSDAQGDTLSGIENLTGSVLADTLIGDTGDNVLEGGGGNDTLVGGDGTDTAVFAGNAADYTITVNSGVVTVSDDAPSTDGDDGTDTLSGIETLRFADAELDISSVPSPASATGAIHGIGTLTGQLEASDVDYATVELEFSLENGAAHGSVTVNSDGSYEYTPDANYMGSDSFTYRVSDPTGVGVVATVSLDVAGNVWTETVVNTTTTDDQDYPSIAALSGGGYVVVWQSLGQDGSYWGIYGQRYDSSGNAVGTEFQANTFTSSSQKGASVAALSGGGFVVTWHSYGQDGDEWGIYGQRYDSSGDAVGSEFQINTFTSDDQGWPSVAALSDGGFVVTWTSNTQDGSYWGVYGQRYDSSGNTVGSEFQINTTTYDYQELPSVTALSGGGFVVTWSSWEQDGSSHGVFGQRYDSSGNTVGNEFQVNTYTSGSQSASSVAALSGGGFVVTWDSYGQDGSYWGVYGQRYDEYGNTVGNEFRVNTYTSQNQEYSSVTGLSDGGFVVTWDSIGQDGSNSGVYAQYFDSDGDPVGSEFLVNSEISGYQGNPSVATLSDGRLAVAWNSYNQDGDGYGIYSTTLNAWTETAVNTTTAGDQDYPSITALSGGGYVVTWNSYGQDGSYIGVFGQLYDSSGSAVGDEFQVNTHTSANQGWSSVAALSGGGFVVTWDSYNQDGSYWGVYGQRFDSSGDTVGNEFRINTTTYEYQLNSSVAALSNGGFVVTWSSWGQDGDGFGIFGQRYDSSGTAAGSEFQVNTFTDSHQQVSSVAALSGGGFVVTWDSYTSDGDYWGISGQRYDASGNAIGSEFQVNTFTSYDQQGSSVIGLSDGGFVVTWHSEDQDGSNFGVYAQYFDSDGDPVGSEFLVNSETSGYQGDPSVAVLSGNRIAVAWNSNNQDGDGYGIYSKILTSSLTLNGGSGPDAFIGSNADDTLFGNAGNDVLSGAGGDDILSGGDGDDILTGGSGGDSLDGGAGVDTLSYEGSYDGVSVDLSTGTVSGGDAQGDTITAFENVRGSSDNDVLTGNSADNVLEGGADGDVIVGGDGSDTASYEHSSSGVTVNLATSTLSGGDAAGDTLTSIENIQGSAHGDTLTGDSGNNILRGGAGNDTISGGEGDDDYLFGRGQDQDVIDNFDDGVSTDRLLLDEGVSAEQLWFTRSGDDLEVSIIGTQDKVTISDWYLGEDYQVDQIETSDGAVLYDDRVEQLQVAMSAFAPPGAGETTLAPEVQTALQPVLAVSWENTGGA